MGLDGRYHLASNRTNTVNNFSTIGPLDRGKGIEYGCMLGRVTAGQAKAGLPVLVTVLSFTQPILPSGDEGGNRLSQNSP